MFATFLNAFRLGRGAKRSIKDKAFARLQALKLANSGRTHAFDYRTGAIAIDNDLLLPCDLAQPLDWSVLLQKSRALPVDWSTLEIYHPSERPKLYSWRSPRISSITFNMVYFVVDGVEVDLGAVTA